LQQTPRSPRHLVERLMFEGIKARRDKSFADNRGNRRPATSGTGMGAGADDKAAAKKARYADTFAKRLADEAEADKVQNFVDVMAIAEVRASGAKGSSATVS